MIRKFAGCVAIILYSAVAVQASSPWVTVEYRDLVDTAQVVRTGETLGDILRRGQMPASLRGAVQPFLDGYSSLLSDALDMISPPGALSLQNVTVGFPPGGREPAWVAIFRSGRICALTDGASRVRLILPGADPRSAFVEHYPVVRHCLAGLQSSESAALTIEAFAYRHDYGRATFSLHTRPFTTRLNVFPPPKNRTPLDLATLTSFFVSGRRVEGAMLDQNGLSLSGSPGHSPRVAGEAVTLADLAIAYRAIVHAGDNAAFISLDPHGDPTRAAVNFGGYLDNTRIGWTVLEADKRFKTISSGLDPSSFEDLRPRIRTTHPGFLTSAERDMIAGGLGQGGWIGTRFWFYPESVDIETDQGFREMSIRSARFTADAERQMSDFADRAAFERFKKSRLGPGIRDCIADLNRHYDRYAAIFPEFAELSTVARLLGLCAWLKRAPRRDVDLDALLAVELPAFRTPESRTQLLAANWVIPEPGVRTDSAFITSRQISVPLSSLLDERIDRCFPSADALEFFLADCPAPRRDAKELLAIRGADPARTLIRHTRDLQAFAKYASRRLAPAAVVGKAAMSVLSISGGINLGADDFRIRIRRAKQTKRTGPPTAKPGSAPPVKTGISRPKFDQAPRTTIPVAVQRETVVQRAALPAQAHSWKDRIASDSGARAREFDARARRLTIVERTGAAEKRVEARLLPGGKIVFRRSP